MTYSGAENNRRMECCIRERRSSLFAGKPASFTFPLRSLFRDSSGFNSGVYDARLVREEQFGPVLPVLRYSDIDAVIARANDTEFGLGGSVWSSDRGRAFGVAARINAGTV